MTASPRPARPDDRVALEDLLRAAGLPVPAPGPVEAAFFVAEGNAGALVGCAGLERYGDYGLLRSVAVAPEVRGVGLGARLTEAVIGDAERRGLRALYALTTTAERYFPRLGFEVIDREAVPREVRASEEFASICPSTATALMLLLRP